MRLAPLEYATVDIDQASAVIAHQLQNYAKGPESPGMGMSSVEVDFWKVEETAFSHPELWWPRDAACACRREAVMSYGGVYYCWEHFSVKIGEGVTPL